MPDRFKELNVIVTGAARGIGKAIATSFVLEGAKVAFVDKDGEALEATVAELAGMGHPAEALTVDCTDFAAVESANRGREQKLGVADILVNNCGQSAQRKSTDFTDSDPAIWEFLIDTNLRSTMNWSRVVAPGMRERGSGKIVNISSESAVFGDPKLVEYGAAKGGVLGFSRGLARELAPFGINVNAISPGITRTREVTDGVPPEIIEAALAQVPRRKISEPEDIAAVVRFLASQDAIGVVGQNIIVSGGRVMQ